MALEQQAARAVGPTPTDGRHPMIERLARAGYAARGLVYGLVGVLAIRAALGAGGDITGPRGALRDLGSGAVGTTLLALLAVGLIGFALWRWTQAIHDTEHCGTGPGGWCLRAGMIASGLIHASWAVLAAMLVFGGDGGASDDAQARGWTATLMMQPFGRWLVAAVGLGVVAFGGNEIRKAFLRKSPAPVAAANMRQGILPLFTAVQRIGLTARGLTLGIIGLFLVIAAWRFDANQACGLGGTLNHVLAQPYGSVLLAVVAAGVIAFGAYNLLLARFRIIQPR